MGIDNTPDDLQEQEVSSQEQPKKIETMEDAVRYAYGVSETKKEIAEITRLAEQEIEKWQSHIREVEEWRDDVLNPLNSKLEYLNSLLTSYHVEQYYLAADNEKAQKKIASIKLPYGVTLKSTQPQVGFEIEDLEKYQEFMEANGFTETVPPKMKWGDMKKTLTVDAGKVVTQNGEVVTFLKVVPQERKFEVK